MKNWLSQHAQTLWLALKRLRQNPFASLLNISVIGIALSLPGGLYVLLNNLESLSRQVSGEPQISLFLSMQAASAEVSQIHARLKSHPGVRNFQFVPRDQALRELQKAAGIADVVQSLTQNPLPDAFIIHAKDSSADALQRLRDEFRSWPNTAHVQLDSLWAQRLEALLRLGKIVILLLAILLSFALVAVTFNTIRLQILTHREEIEVAKLIGATHRFIRRPFLYIGALQGLAGGVVAWAVVAVSIQVLNIGIADLTRLYTTNFQLNQPNTSDSVSLMLFSAWLGWLGAWMSVSRHLHQIEPR
ncbi:MAG TPA: permease-like cell division protein FtsX [Burkholderiales bacterium]|nr:permease-like cell division protein FtsX [Burkholderiales bacterium]